MTGKDTVLVTGGAGYIGSVVAAELVQAGHRVVVYDNLSTGHREAVPEGCRLEVAELGDGEALDRVFREERPTAVMHFAAFTDAGASMRVPEQYFRNNTASALTLLETMLRHDVKRFVFSSTAAVYGQPEAVPITEDAALAPTNAYGESKLFVERMLEWLFRAHGLRSASLRYFNAAGAAPGRGEDHDPETHLVPILLQVALGQRERVSVFGTDYPTPDGTCIRDYIHIQDLASAHLLALEALRDRPRLVYNLGSGQGFSVKEVIDVARRVTGHPIPAVEVERRAGDPPRLVASSDRIMADLGWERRYPDLDSIVRSAWEWHSRRPQGYRTEVPAGPR